MDFFSLVLQSYLFRRYEKTLKPAQNTRNQKGFGALRFPLRANVCQGNHLLLDVFLFFSGDFFYGFYHGEIAMVSPPLGEYVCFFSKTTPTLANRSNTALCDIIISHYKDPYEPEPIRMIHEYMSF